MTKATRQSLDDVFRGQRPLLLRTLSRMVGNAAVAEDLVQETYLRVAAAVRERPVDYVQPFLYQTARNLAFDHLRAERRRTHVIANDVAGDTLAGVPSEAPSPHARTRDRQLLEHLEAALDGLTPRQRAVFVRAKVDGRSYAEIAAELEVSTSTVQKELKAAMATCVRVFQRLGIW